MSMLFLGMGFIISLAFLANLTTRLLSNSTPDPKKAWAMLIPVATLSNAAYASAQLVRASRPNAQEIAG